MIDKIEIKGKYYKQVPELYSESCKGCVFFKEPNDEKYSCSILKEKEKHDIICDVNIFERLLEKGIKIKLKI